MADNGGGLNGVDFTKGGDEVGFCYVERMR
jgi:hypothetical protein